MKQEKYLKSCKSQRRRETVRIYRSPNCLHEEFEAVFREVLELIRAQQSYQIQDKHTKIILYLLTSHEFVENKPKNIALFIIAQKYSALHTGLL